MGKIIAVTFTNEGDAKEVLAVMLKLQKQYGLTTRGDFLSLTGAPSTFEDEKVGWTDLTEDTPIKQVGEDEFLLDLPEPTITAVRTQQVSARYERHASLTEQVRTLAERDHRSNVQIAQELGLTESEVRVLLKGE